MQSAILWLLFIMFIIINVIFCRFIASFGSQQGLGTRTAKGNRIWGISELGPAAVELSDSFLYHHTKVLNQDC